MVTFNFTPPTGNKESPKPAGKAVTFPAKATFNFTPPVAKESGLPEKKPTLGSKVVGVGKELVKGIVSPVATIVARPFQAVAELAGASSESVDKFSSKISGGLIAPVPQNASDVVKDVGRGAETVLLGAGGAGLKGATLGKTVLKEAAIGAGFGAASAVEQGGLETKASDLLKSTAIGGVLGAVAPAAIKGASKLFKFATPAAKIAEDATLGTSKEIAPTVEKTVLPGKGIPGAPSVESPIPTYNTNIPEAAQAPKIPLSNKGDTVAKAAQDIHRKIAQEGFNSLPEEELAKYNSVSRADQVEKIGLLLDADINAATDMALTGKNIPKEIEPQILFNAVKSRASELGNVDLQMQLAKSPIASQRSILAQKLGAAATLNDPADAVTVMSNLNKNLEETISKKLGKPIEVARKEVLDSLKKEVAKVKVTKQTFQEFVNNLSC